MLVGSESARGWIANRTAEDPIVMTIRADIVSKGEDRVVIRIVDHGIKGGLKRIVFGDNLRPGIIQRVGIQR